MKRVVFGIDDKTYDKVQSMRVRLEKCDLAGVLTTALTLLYAVVEQADKGYTDIVVCNPKTDSCIRIDIKSLEE